MLSVVAAERMRTGSSPLPADLSNRHWCGILAGFDVWESRYGFAGTQYVTFDDLIAVLRMPGNFSQIMLHEGWGNSTAIPEMTIGVARESRRPKWRRCINFAFLLFIPTFMLVVLCVLRHSTVVVSSSVHYDDMIWLRAFGLLLSVGNIMYFIWVVALAIFRYREFAPVSDAMLPTCTVIVPAYNEGRHVLTTLQSILSGSYPAEKLEVVAVNDGSCDDTWHWISTAVEKSGGKIHAINLEQNRGKRGAIHAGILASRGEIVVTVDSDSVVLPDTLRRIVSPFVADVRVGGVAGNVRVFNWNDGLIPKMLDVNFVFSFDLIRTAQSVVRAVFCSPGALTAFRRVVFIPEMNAWVNQKFLGHPAVIGEDRALTNLILKSGYAVVFQRSAVVLTRVPQTYRGVCKMLIRWARSNIRENLEMLLFAFDFRNNVAYSRFALIINLAAQLCWMISPLIALCLFIYCMVATMGTFLLLLMPMLVLFTAFPASVYFLKCGRSGACMVYLYALFGFIAMFWTASFALFSFHRSGWLTR